MSCAAANVADACRLHAISKRRISLATGSIMKPLSIIRSLAMALLTLHAVADVVFAQAAPAASASATATLPADPWPRDLSITGAAVLVYQPQLNGWVDNRIDFRCALAIKPDGAAEETFGVIFASARTRVDKTTRTVLLDDLQVTKSDFPRLPDHGAAYAAELQKTFATRVRTISLDRLKHSPALSGARPVPVECTQRPAARDRQHLPGDPGADRRAARGAAGAGQRALRARHQHARADPAARHREGLLPPCVRRLADGEIIERPVDAAVPAADGHDRCREEDRGDGRGRHARWRSPRESEAFARERHTGDLRDRRHPRS